MHALRLALYALFALSGFCGLVYESIWSHYLRNYLGHAAHGQTVVLVIFIGGLALGAWLAARHTSRLRDPLLAYAVAEVAIGLAALVFHPAYVAFTAWAYDTLLPAACGGAGVCGTQWATAALLIAAPAIALGTTFPWMVAAVVRRMPGRPGHAISMLYFLNSFGAVIGVLAAAFVIVPALGLPGTVVLAGALNVAIGLAVAAIAWRAPLAAPVVAATAVPPEPAGKPKARRARAEAATAAAASSREAAPQPSRSLVHAWLAVAALTGLASFVYEIVWIRMLSLVLGASTHSFELMLAAFILGLAAGGAWMRNRIDRLADARSFLGHVQVWMGVAALVTLPLYGAMFDAFAWLMRGLARTDPGYALFQIAGAALSLAVMLPATFLAGMTLPLVTRRLFAAGVGERAIGSVYALNAVGAIVGVAATVHVLIPMLGLKGALAAGALIDILIGIALLRRPRGELAFSWPGFASVIGGLAAFGIIVAAVQLDPMRMASGVYGDGVARLPEPSKLVFHADGKTATVSVVDSSGRRLLRTNGKTDASIALPGHPPTADEPTQVLLGALAIAANPKAKRAAVIGMGSGMTSVALLASPSIQRVDTIEIERRVVEAAKLFGERNAPLFSDERSHFVYDDAKAWLARGAAPWDIVVSEPSNPWVSGVASLFGAETYARVAQALAPGGVFVQWIQTYEIDGPVLSSIFRALAAHFPHYAVYHGDPGDLIVVASRDRKPAVDASVLFRERGMAAVLQGAGVASVVDVESRWRGDATVFNALLAAFEAPSNSDFRPFVDQRAARARFVRASLQPLFREPIGPTALLETLGADVPRRSSQPALAAALAAAIAEPAKAAPALSSAHAAYADALRATRELVVTCKPQGPKALLLEGAVGVAIAVNDLPRPRAEAVWAGVREGPCYRSLDAPVQLWVDMFAAVAARDAAAMSELGTGAVTTAPTEFARDYALAVAVSGHIAQGRPEVGGKLLELRTGTPESAWTILMRELAAGRSIAPRAAL